MDVIYGEKLEFAPASHEIPGAAAVFRRILVGADAMPPGKIQMINWARMPVGGTFRAHYHQAMTEVFIICRGETEIHIDAEHARLKAGDAVVIPPNAVHYMSNVGSEEVDYVVIGIVEKPGGKTIVVDRQE